MLSSILHKKNSYTQLIYEGKMKIIKKNANAFMFLSLLFCSFTNVNAADGIGELIAKDVLQKSVPESYSASHHIDDLLHESKQLTKVLHAKASVGESIDDGIQQLTDRAAKVRTHYQQINAKLDDMEQRLRDLGLTNKLQQLAQYREEIAGEYDIYSQQIDAITQVRSSASTNSVATPSNMRSFAVAGQKSTQSANANSQSNTALINRLEALNGTLSKRKREKVKPAGAALPLVFSTPTSPPVTAPPPENVVFNLTGAPAAEDLKSTAKVEITPRIKNLANELGNSPVRIYEYVRNNIEFEPYHGSLKNAETVLLSKKGNDHDTATLLIALLRSAGIPARYARAKVMVPLEDATNWLEVTRVEVAYHMFRAFGDTEVAYSTEDGTPDTPYTGIIKEQVWVVAYVPYGNYRGSVNDQSDKRWVSLDPSFKTRQIQDGIVLDLSNPALNFDYDAYLSSTNKKTPAEVYQDQVRQYLRDNMPDKTILDIPHRGKIDQENIKVLPSNLPYIIARTPTTFYEIEDDYYHKVKFDLKQKDGTNLLSYPYKNITSISNKRLTLSFIAATSADQAIVDSYGGFDQVPTTAVLNVLPVVKEQGVVVLTGATPIAYGEDLDVKLTWLDFANGYVSSGSKLPNEKDTTAELVAGNFMNILLDIGQASNDFINDRLDKFLAAHDAVTTAEKNTDLMMGEMLYIAGVRYAQLLDQYFLMIGDLDNVRNYKNSFNVGTTSMTNQVSYVFGKTPFAVKADSFLIDGKSGSITIFQLGNRDPDTYDPHREAKLAGYTFAALEHQVWEELTHLTSVSTVKGMQLAGENDVTIYNLVPADSTSICLLYTVGTINDWCANNPDDVLNSRVTSGQKDLTIKVETFKKIKADLEANRNVTIPKQTLAVNSWQGEVWITHDPSANSFAFMIAGKTASGNGGSTTSSTPFAQAPPLDPTGTRSLFGDKVEVNPVTGNLNVSGTDFQINGRGIPITFSRSYNSRLKTNGPMGYGWSHTFDLYIQERDDDGDQTPSETEDSDGVISSVRLFDATGGQFDYTVAGGGTYTNDPGVYSTLTKDVGTGVFTLVEKSGSRMTFGPIDGNGKAKLATMQDVHGNTITLSYGGPGGNIDTVTDTVGRALSFSYQSHGGQQRLTQIEDWTSRRWQYGYDSNGNLTSFRHPLAVNDQTINPVTYTYYDRSDINHNIKEIIQPLGDTVSFVYYTNDKVYKQSNSLGNTNVYRYNEFRQETTVIDPLGYESRVEYDTDGNIVRNIDALGAVKETKYDSNRNVVEKIDAYGNSTYFNKDETGAPISIVNGNITHTTDRLGNVTRKLNYHPTFHKPRQIIDALGNVTNLVYDNTNGDLLTRTQTVTLRKGEPDEYVATVVSENAYDSYGNLIRMTVAKDVVDQEKTVTNNYTLDELGSPVPYPGLNLMYSTDALGHSVYYTYDDLDRRTSEINYRQISPSNTDNYRIVSSYTYDLVDRAIEITDPAGNITVKEYDDNNRISKEYIKLPLSGGGYEDKYLIQHIYDKAGREIKTIDPLGNFSTKEYDAKGQLIAVTDAKGHVTRYEYDPLGRQIKTIDAEGNVGKTFYDFEGRVVKVVDALGNSIKSEYDAEGRLTKQLDELSRETTFQYDDNGNKTHVTDNLLRTSITRYDELNRVYETETPSVLDGPTGSNYPIISRNIFNEVGNLVEIKTGHTGMTNLDLLYRYEYDIQGRLRRQTDVLGKVAETNYDQLGYKLWIRDAKGQVTNYTHDAMGRLTEIAPQDGNNIVNTYNQIGSKLSTRNNHVNYSYKYDDLLRLIEVKDWRLNKTIRYTYDELSNVISVISPEGDVSNLRYDAVNQLAEISYADGEGVSYVYDAAGNLTQKLFSIGVNVKYTYKADNNLESISNYKSFGQLVSSNTYTYNQIGLRDSMTDSNGMHVYQYDEIGRLTRVDYPVSTVHPSGFYEAYTYNYLGDRHSLDQNGISTYYNYDAMHRLQDIRSGSTTGTVLYDLDYDDNHNLIQKINQTVSPAQTTTYQYSASDDMVGIAFHDTTTNGFKYGPGGNRIETTDKAGTVTRMIYAGDDVAVEYDSSGLPIAQFRHGQSTDELLSVLRGGTRSYFHQNGLGSVVAISDQAGATQATYRYDAFGKVLEQTGSVQNTYGYTGRRLDSESGLMYYRARYYDPEIGRFTQQDPSGIADGLNTYAYVGNNPISKTDPTGLWGSWGSSSFSSSSWGSSSFSSSSWGRSSYSSFSSSSWGRSSYSSFSSSSWGRSSSYSSLSSYGYTNIRPSTYRISSYSGSGFRSSYTSSSWSSSRNSSWSTIGSFVGIAASVSPIGRIGSLFKSAYSTYKASRISKATSWLSSYKTPSWSSAGGSSFSSISRPAKSSFAKTHVYLGQQRNKPYSYVGITNNLKARERSHQRSWRKLSSLRPITANPLTRRQARSVEQAIIIHNPHFTNKINSISPRRRLYNGHVRWGERWLDDNGYGSLIGR